MGKDNPSSSCHPVRLPLSCELLRAEFRHHHLPGLNLVATNQEAIKTGEEIIKLYSEPLISTRKPLPCLNRDQFTPITGNEDPALKLVRNKYLWKRRKTQILDKFHQKYKKNTGKCQISTLKRKRSKDKTKAPYIVVKLADHISKNPDKSFNGLYNWYFDNALAAVQTNGNQYLLHAGGEKLNKLCISTIGSRNVAPSIPVVTPKFNMPMEKDGQIFHIFLSQTNDRIGVRQRDSCKIFRIDEDRDMDTIVKECHVVESGKHPFVSADITRKEVCTIDANRLMKLWRVSKEKCISEASLPESDSFLSDRFARIQFSRHCNSITAIDRKNIYSFDSRLNLNAPVSKWSCDSYVEKCEDISLMIQSAKDNKYYIGATHSCLLLDMRSGFVQKWTHLLPQTPTIGHATMVELESGDSTELLMLSSQCSDEVVAICNSTSSESAVTCTPFSLPTRTDTLHEARTRGLLYQPVLQEKFDFSLIGLTSCDVFEYPTLFSLISAGEIFQQKLQETSHHTIKLSKREISYLESWENETIKSFAQRKKPRLVISHTAAMEDLFSELEEVEIPEWKVKPANLEKIRKFTKKELESYTDLLAPTILADYGALDDSDWEDADEVVPNSSSKSVNKVQSWLHSDNTFNAAGCEDNLDELSQGSALTSDGDLSVSNVDDTSILSFELTDDEL